MKKSLVLLFAAAALLAAGCSHKEYDLTDGINKEISLFEKGITVPVGNIGPVTLNDLLERMGDSPLLSMAKDFLPAADEDGWLCVTMQKKEVYSAHILEIDRKITDKDKPYVVDFGTLDTSAPLGVTLMGAVGFVFPNQQAVFYARQPLNVPAPLTGLAQMRAMDMDTFSTVYLAEKDLGGTSVPQGSSDYEIARLEAQEGVYAGVNAIALENLKMELPANMTDRQYASYNKEFTISCSYKSRLGVGPKLKLPMSNFPIKFSLPLGRFDLRKASVSMDVENTLPIRLELTEVSALDEDGNVNPAISIGGGIIIQGGLPSMPAISPVTLEIEALEGRIPDLYGLQLSFVVSAEPALPVSPIRVDQGISVKSANATLTGGITINKK